MPKTLWLALMLSASLVGLVLAQSHHGDTSSGPPESGFAAQMMQAMQRMDAGMMAAKSTGNPDRDFAAMMIPHHQGAIDMAVAYLRYGKNERLRRLAQEIIITQSDEIAVMRLVVDPPLAQASSRVPSQSSTMPQAAMCPLESSSTVHGSMHDHRNP